MSSQNSVLANLDRSLADALAYARALSDNAIDRGETISDGDADQLIAQCNRILTALHEAHNLPI
jgi:hypothetical protein